MNLIPITWPGGNMDPFWVNPDGKIITVGKRLRGCNSLSARDAIKFWNSAKSRSWSKNIPTDEPKPRTPDDLFDTPSEFWFERSRESSGFVIRPPRENKVRWFYIEHTPSPPCPNQIARLMPTDWITKTGDAQSGWYGLTLEGRFDSLVHGPSLWLHLSTIRSKNGIIK